MSTPAAVEALVWKLRALRVQRFYDEWPEGHSERKSKPAFVREFEARWGTDTGAPFLPLDVGAKDS